MGTDIFAARERRLANLIWRQGPLSRSELKNLTGIHPNLVGISADRLMKLGLVRECSTSSTGPGRPSLPLEVNPAMRSVLGIAISPGQVESASLSLRGELVGEISISRNSTPARNITAATNILRKAAKSDLFAVGVSVTGLVDLDLGKLLFSSAGPSSRDISLQPMLDAAGNIPLVIDNDQHALAARWLLTHKVSPREDILLVGFDDGRMGASHLVGGRPSRGCVVSANELGHTRLPIATPGCFCGHTGCLERICSSEFVQFTDKKTDGVSLAALAADRSQCSRAFDLIIESLACGFSNAVNFTRPNRLVLASPLGRKPPFADALLRSIRSLILPALVDRVRVEWWDESIRTSAENAGWLALASVFYNGWHDSNSADAGRNSEDS